MPTQSFGTIKSTSLNTPSAGCVPKVGGTSAATVIFCNDAHPDNKENLVTAGGSKIVVSECRYFSAPICVVWVCIRESLVSHSQLVKPFMLVSVLGKRSSFKPEYAFVGNLVSPETTYPIGWGESPPPGKVKNGKVGP